VSDGTPMVLPSSCATESIDASLVIHTPFGRFREDRWLLDTICRSRPFSAPINTSVGTPCAMSYWPLARAAMKTGRS
jgi:hypothetical protein